MTKRWSNYLLAFTIVFSLVNITLAQDYSEQQSKTFYTHKNPYPTVSVLPAEGDEVENVILMIADGMSLTQVSTAWVANRGKLNLDNFTHTGITLTYAANKLITDSGASGTALATGNKTKYHAVGVDSSGNPVPSIMDLAVQKGLGTAVVVTCGLTDATPATFCASNSDREKQEDIALDYLTVNADYIFGGGRKRFNQRTDKRDILKEMQDVGYQVTTSWEETRKISSGKVFAVVEDGQLPMAPERGDIFQDAVMQAIDIISKKEKGFFAMFEGSRIDDCGHWHDIPALLGEIYDFDQTVGKVLQWAEKDGKTLVVVLADHETGGLTLLDGDIQSGTVKGHFSTGGHSDIMVPVFAYGPQAHLFTGIFENTDVFYKIKQLLDL
ncbi:MAG: alkaline phosphatase [Bacteroidota bacterium]